jgi:hypothetical protein
MILDYIKNNKITSNSETLNLFLASLHKLFLMKSLNKSLYYKFIGMLGTSEFNILVIKAIIFLNFME